MQLSFIEVRDNRQKEWFWIDNEFLDRYSRLVGPVATLVYMALSRHADQGTQSCFPSMQTIADEMGIKSRKTVAKGIKALQDFNIISIQENHGAGGIRQNNSYSLVNRRMWRDAKPEPKVEKAPVAVKPVQEKLPVNAAFELPSWLNAEAWGEWEKYRRELKKPLTASSVKLQIKMLEDNKADHAEILRKSIANGWMGLFPLKGTDKKVAKVEAPKGKYAHLSS